MTNACKCEGCGRFFTPDYRNAHKQSYCTRVGCQRMRRTSRQRLRRQSQAEGRKAQIGGNTRQGGASRPQTASLISEADLSSEHPVIIGLISMITGQTDAKSIEAVYKNLWIRGKQILSERSLQDSPNSPFVSMLEEIQRASKA